MAYLAEGDCPKCGKRKRFGLGHTHEEATAMMNERSCTVCELKLVAGRMALIFITSWLVIHLILKIMKSWLGGMM